MYSLVYTIPHGCALDGSPITQVIQLLLEVLAWEGEGEYFNFSYQ